MNISNIDLNLISFLRKISIPFGRISLFVVFFWFGILKVLGPNLSPASPLVQNLFEHTMPIMPFSTFIFLFGIFECVIGVLFLIPKAERIVIPMLLIHMATTVMPLFLLPQVAWSGFMVPTLEGQYIIKNILIIAVSIVIAAHLHPMSEKKIKSTR